SSSRRFPTRGCFAPSTPWKGMSKVTTDAGATIACARLGFWCHWSLQSQALRFLHTYNIVHSNVKSPNVLLDWNGTAKLSDFSLARVSATINAHTGGGSHGKVNLQLEAFIVLLLSRNFCSIEVWG
ncbi:unnamed protein product, partial [Hapterophycus canaliculatus]